MRVDCTGLRCPAHVARIERVMDEVEVGDVVEVVLDGDEAVEDVEAWCRVTGNAVVGRERRGDELRIYLERRV